MVYDKSLSSYDRERHEYSPKYGVSTIPNTEWNGKRDGTAFQALFPCVYFYWHNVFTQYYCKTNNAKYQTILFQKLMQLQFNNNWWRLNILIVPHSDSCIQVT